MADTAHIIADTSENRAQLAKILSSSSFRRSIQVAKLLEIAAEESMAGRTDNLTQHEIGKRLFGLEEFDPDADSNVRRNAGLLRAALTKYYSVEGQGDTIRFSMPKGGYLIVAERSVPEDELLSETVRQENSNSQPSESEIRDLVARIENFLTEAGENLPRPRRGLSATESSIKLLQYLTESAIRYPHRSVPAEEISERCFNDPQRAVRKFVTDLRKQLAEYDFARGSSSPVRVSLPERRNMLVFRYAVQRAERTTANAGEFWRLLLAMCREFHLAQEDVEREFWEEWVDDHNYESQFHEIAASHRSSAHPESQRAFIDGLADHLIPVEDMRSIGSLFGIHQLIFDPLLSTVTNSTALTFRLREDFFAPPRLTVDGWQRVKAEYTIPLERLTRTDEEIIQLTITRGGRSDTHNHLGEEVIIVLDGQIDFHLDESGIVTTLNSGDYVHFYAEQTHSVVALKDSRLLILRSHQIGVKNTRQEMRREVESISKEFKHVSTLCIAWIQQSISPGPRTGSAHVNDKVGLARFLCCIREYNNFREVSPSPGCPHDQMRAWEGAKRNVASADLREISECYNVESALLRPYLYPAFPNIVVVRSSDLAQLHFKSDGYWYRNPIRRLACSDITIAELTLQPKSACPVINHPGSALLIPLEGAATVYSKVGDKDVEMCYFSKSGEVCAHYKSETPHFVRNDTDYPARCWVVRFYCDGPWSTDSPPRL